MGGHGGAGDGFVDSFWGGGVKLGIYLDIRMESGGFLHTQRITGRSICGVLNRPRQGEMTKIKCFSTMMEFFSFSFSFRNVGGF